MGILDEIKSVITIVQKIQNLELYEKIVSLQQQIEKILDEKTQLKNEINSLKEKLKIKESLSFKDNTYWRKKSEGVMDGPFCTNCWDTGNNLVRLITCLDPQYSQCPTCKIPLEVPKTFT